MNIFLMVKSFPFLMTKHLLCHLLITYYSVLDLESELI